MLEAIKEMTIGELLGSGALLLAGIFTVIKISPLKIDPWAWIFSAIGRALNRDILQEVKTLKEDIEKKEKQSRERDAEVIEKVNKLEDDFKKAEHRKEERDIKDARVRVLRFGDELIHDVRHTKEHFDEILLDITEYEKYCDTHPDFENDRMTLTAQIIKETYHNCMVKRTFLEIGDRP